MSEPSDYQPGYCNIGRRQRRRRFGYAGVCFAVVVLAGVGHVGGVVPRPLLLGTFIPFALGFEYALQAYTSFCVRLALLNRYDFSGGGNGRSGTVTDPDARRDDQVYAAKITAVAVVLGVASTAVLVVALP